MKNDIIPYTLTFESTSDYLRVLAQGQLSTTANRVDAWKTILSKCRNERFVRLLVIQESPGNNSNADAFNSTVEIIALGLNGLRIAFVDRDLANHDHNSFAELVAQNRGVQGKVFTDESQAKEWLLGMHSLH